MTQVDPEIASAVAGLMAEQDAAWNAGDAAAFCGSALPDVVFTNIVGMFSVGREPFQAQHQAIFATIYKASTLSQSLAHLSVIRPDVLVVDTVCEVSDYGHLPPGVSAVGGVLRTRLEQVLVLQDGRWRVAAFHNVPINPAAAGGAPP